MKKHHFHDYIVRMNLQEVRGLVESTADPAFAVDEAGIIIAWNRSVVEWMGVTKEQAIGRPCGEIICGNDECGPVCSENCVVRQTIQRTHPVKNFDIQVPTKQGRQWCNVSVLLAQSSRSAFPYAIHVLRPIDVLKRLELTMRDFNATTATRSVASGVELTGREREILKLLATGAKTTAIAQQLSISRTTLNNHIQHILRKLDCHSRLEAIRRAERAGLL